MVAEWNIRQEELADAHYDAAMARWRASPAKYRGPAPKPPEHRRRPQSAAQAALALAKATQVKGSQAGLAFFLGNGLLRVS